MTVRGVVVMLKDRGETLIKVGPVIYCMCEVFGEWECDC